MLFCPGRAVRAASTCGCAQRALGLAARARQDDHTRAGEHPAGANTSSTVGAGRTNMKTMCGVCDVSFFLVPQYSVTTTEYGPQTGRPGGPSARSKRSNQSVRTPHEIPLATSVSTYEPRCKRSLRLRPVEGRLDHVRGRLVPVLTILHDEAALWVAREAGVRALVRVSSP